MMTALKIENQAILASAGSGKTFQLAHRYIKLLALDVGPERLIALTFSRKAAREIFDAIIDRLCRAATDENERVLTCEMIGVDLSSSGFRDILANVLKNMHRLNIGTLDSFIVSILRNFPMELGISSSFSLMDGSGSEAETLREDVLGEIFSSRHVSKSDQRAFLDAFRRAMFGHEQKAVHARLNDILTDWHTRYLDLPDISGWGQATKIWPQGVSWFEGEFEIEKAAELLTSWGEAQGFSEKAVERLHNFAEDAINFAKTMKWSNPIEYIFKQLDISALRAGSATMKIDRKDYTIDADGCGAMLELVSHVIRIALLFGLEQTAGIFKVLEQYECAYKSVIQQCGKLTFSDAQYLLASNNPRSLGRALSQTGLDPMRLSIDYRLDKQLDHWMLDEFQDTSDLQWDVLSNLADELVQDVSGRRSLFYVGDIKQAIYGWRGGNPELFLKIQEGYEGRFVNKPLTVSYRSCSEVISAVNDVFGELVCDELPERAVERWAEVWRKHSTAVKDASGHVALLEPVCLNPKEKPGEEDRYKAVADILNQVNPSVRGLSTAILVRTNIQGVKLTAFLRKNCPSLKIVNEGNTKLYENDAVTLLLALVKYAAHPGDTLARGHIQMSPLGMSVDVRLDDSAFSAQLLDGMQRLGMRGFIRRWRNILGASAALSEFTADRLNQLENAAIEFDGLNLAQPDDFLSFASHYGVKGAASGETVRVMTIHQSKGLGFDIVILPELQNQSIEKAFKYKYLRDGVDENGGWILKNPGKWAVAADDVLRNAKEQTDVDVCFENLCALYVAMTRAKRGLYLITSYPGKTAKSLNMAAFLKRQLGMDMRILGEDRVQWGDSEYVLLYEKGRQDWYQGIEPRDAKEIRAERKSIDIPSDFSVRKSRRVRLRRVMPSVSTGDDDRRIGDLFAEPYGASLQFGNAIHDLFKELEWIDGRHEEDIAGEWSELSAFPDSLKKKVTSQFLVNLGKDEIREIFEKSTGKSQLWREKSFEIVLDGEWISGAFDRVTIIEDAAGNPVHAYLLDYKSNRITDEAGLGRAVESYRSQIETYRRVLSRMLRLPPAEITAQLLFTHSVVLRSVAPKSQ